MQIDRYRAWLRAQEYKDSGNGTRITDARRVEQDYGDLDEAYQRDRCADIFAALAYSQADEAAGRPNPTSIEIDGNLNRGLSGYRSAVRTYCRFRDAVDENPDTGLTREDVLAAVSRCDAAGSVDAYIATLPGLGHPHNYWLVLDGKRYPSKAVTRDAMRATGDEREVGGSICKQVLEQLGFMVVHWPNLRQACATFLQRMQGFTSFAAPGPYQTTEREYKDRAADALREIVQGPASDIDAGKAILRRLTLGEPGLPLGWQTLDAISKTDATVRDDVFRAIGNLARADADDSTALEIAARVLEHSAKTGLAHMRSGAVLSSVISVWGTLHPDQAAWFKVRRMSEAAKQLFGRTLFPSGTFQQADFEDYAQLMRALLGLLDREMGWQPQDLVDVQGFIWVALASDKDWYGDDVATAPPPDETEHPSTTPRSDTPMPSPTNLILYGPPGTGKTFTTAREAVRLCGEAVPEDREALMALYRSLQHKGRIGFVTFHQNFAYEDFVEGLRPVTDGGESEGTAGFALEPQDGVFKQMAEIAASNHGRAISPPPTIDRSRKVFKMSLGRSRASEDDAIYQDAIRDGYVTLGWGGEIDWADPRYDTWEGIKERWRQDHPNASGNDPNMSQMYTFRIAMEPGSLVIISDGNRKFRAIGQITGPYEYRPGHNSEYNHYRPVRWLWYGESLPRERIYAKELSQVSAYRMNAGDVNWDGIEQTVASGGDAVATSGEPEPHVLIIDEINRANISKVFGELITLLEPDKRLGMPNALTVRLPYSKTEFGVPANLHVIGTMNTADRSIALLDTALRRRFTFREMAPEPRLLEKVGGIDLCSVLSTINERIEYLVDREHRIGPAFFIHCRSRDDVNAVMRDKVIPLLQEYFFEDWSRIAAVVGPGFIQKTELKAPPGFGDLPPRPKWEVRADFAANAYDDLVGGKEVTATNTEGEGAPA